MKIPTSYFIFSNLALVFLLTAGPRLGAQTTANVLNGSGHIAITGDAFSTTTLPVNTTLFYWIPSGNAFRFGTFDLNSANAGIGHYSLAGPQFSVASGDGSIALGPYTTASGGGALAAGWGATATAFQSIALGSGSFVQSNSNNGVAIGGGYVNSIRAGVAIGTAWVYAGDYPMPLQSTTTGDGAFSAVGGTASGFSAVSMGVLNTAAGFYSTAFGGATTVNARGGTAIGMGNLGVQKDGVTVPDNETPAPDDPIVEDGNGYLGSEMETNNTADSSPTIITKSNALTVYRDGTIRMYKASGGISMGQFQ
jgi:hypothetical protein